MFRPNVSFLIFALSSFLIIAPASAYIDPGVGSMVWQGLLALFLVGSYAMKKYWIRVKCWFDQRRDHS